MGSEGAAEREALETTGTGVRKEMRSARWAWKSWRVSSLRCRSRAAIRCGWRSSLARWYSTVTAWSCARSWPMRGRSAAGALSDSAIRVVGSIIRASSSVFPTENNRACALLHLYATNGNYLQKICSLDHFFLVRGWFQWSHKRESRNPSPALRAPSP